MSVKGSPTHDFSSESVHLDDHEVLSTTHTVADVDRIRQGEHVFNNLFMSRVTHLLPCDAHGKHLKTTSPKRRAGQG